MNNLKYTKCDLGDFSGGYIQFNNFIIACGRKFILKEPVGKTYYFNFPLNKTYNDMLSLTTEAIRDIENPECQLATIIGNTKTSVTIKDDINRNQLHGFTLCVNVIFKV